MNERDEWYQETKKECKAKMKALLDELSVFDITFNSAITGSPECFDIWCYGKPSVRIVGGIHTDTYSLEIWARETGKEHLFSSRISKEKMMNTLNMYLPKKKGTEQMALL